MTDRPPSGRGAGPRATERGLPALVLAALCLAALTGPTAAQPPALELEPVASGLPTVTTITHAGDDRVFLALRDGRILILAGGEIAPEPFLDLGPLVTSGGERGLLGLAFHPAYAENGRFFVDYTDLAGDTVVARYQVSADPGRADPASGVTLLTISQPFANHNGGQLQFGPDGTLYIASGDGGSANDPLCRAQSQQSLLGKLLRIDVDTHDDAPPYYANPPDNPFVGPGNLAEEVWALGLRNPWRFSFDRATGDLYIGDVGQGEREEVDFLPAGSPGGANFGWKIMEGTRCTGNTQGCSPSLPACFSPAYTPPVLDYPHAAGDCSITGGTVYRGGRIPALAGFYVYGDFCTGRLWAARRESGAWQAQELALRAPLLTTFGEDRAGEIYLASGDTLYRLTGPGPSEPCVPGLTSLCLVEGRFEVTARWRTRRGLEGDGGAEDLTPDSGYFWFFDRNAPEIFVKMVDACAGASRHFWFFAAGLTDVEVTLEVRDALSGEAQTYTSSLGTPFAPIQDTSAFATCP